MLGFNAAMLSFYSAIETPEIGFECEQHRGSCGKTTTKELIAAVLQTEHRGRKSPGHGNGLAVVGRTVLRTSSKDGFCVL